MIKFSFWDQNKNLKKKDVGVCGSRIEPSQYYYNRLSIQEESKEKVTHDDKA
jgi:hypothetical protein